MADPAAPTDVARRLTGLGPPGQEDAWDVEVVSEPFTTGSEDVQVAAERLEQHRREHGWDVVVGLTELPLHDEGGGHLAVETAAQDRVAVVSLPALGGFRTHARAGHAVRSAIGSMTSSTTGSDPGPAAGRVTVSGARGRLRVLTGMVVANRPWLLVPGLKSALVAALATGAVATVNSTVWLLAASLSWWRLVVACVVAIALVIGWLVVDAGLWDRPDDDSPGARHRSRLYNTSTLLTLLLGVLTCYAALFAVNLLWALFVLDPSVVASSARRPYGYGDLVVLAWFVASAATVGGGLGSGLESDEAVRAAAYSKREEVRRNRLGDDQHDDPHDDPHDDQS